MVQVPAESFQTIGSSGQASPYISDIAQPNVASAIGEGLTNIGESLLKIEKANGQASALSATTQGDLHIQQQMQDLELKSPPGGAGFADATKKTIDDYYKPIIDAEGNPYAKSAIQKHYDQSQAKFGTYAIEWQSKQRVKYRQDQLFDSVDTIQKSLSIMSPEDANAQVKAALDNYNAIIDGEMMPPDVKIKMKDEARKKVTYAATLNIATANPDIFLQKVGDSRDPDSLLSDMNASVGIRNNNPGNLRGDDKWQGKTGADDKGYVKFDTPQSGIRALAVNLINQQEKHGLNTVTDIINKYAPAGDNNDTEAYISHVSEMLGVAPDKKLNLKNQELLTGLVGAVIHHENGSQPYSDRAINSGVMLALGKEAKKEDDPKQTGLQSFDMMDFSEQQQMIRFAEQRSRQLQAGARSELSARTKDSAAMAQNGIIDPSPPKAQDFIKAYGKEEGIAQYNDFVDVLKWGADINNVATQTPAQQASTLLAHKPVAGDGFDEDQRRYATLQKAVVEVNNQRQKDPMGWAIQNKLTGAEILNVANTNTLAQGISAREATAKMLQNTYGLSPNIFTDGEVKAISGHMQEMGADGKLKYLGALASGIDDTGVYRTTIEQLRPDSPVTAMAGAYLGMDGVVKTGSKGWFPSVDVNVTGYSVAQKILRGEEMLNPTKTSKKEDGIGREFKMPPDKDFRDAFNDKIGDAFIGSPEHYNEYYQAARAYYAADGAKQDGVYDDAVGRRAMSAVLGDVANINGTKVLPPWGMNADKFSDVASQKFSAAARANGIDPKYTDWSDVQLVTMGQPNAYGVKSGSGYILDKRGKPMVLEITADDDVIDSVKSEESKNNSTIFPKM